MCPQVSPQCPQLCPQVSPQACPHPPRLVLTFSSEFGDSELVVLDVEAWRLGDVRHLEAHLGGWSWPSPAATCHRHTHTIHV